MTKKKDNADPVTIVSLDIENVKRVQAVSLRPAATGLTVIGGDNRQGKTSVLDSIMSALGGEKFTPSNAVHEGAQKGEIVLTLSNGITVTKSLTAKGAYLKVEDATGARGGQGLLNEFISEFALHLGKFTSASDKEKAKILLETIGVDLTPYEERHKKLYAERENVGRLRDRAKGHADSMPYNETVGSVIQTPSDIMAELEKKVQINAKNREIRGKAEAFLANIDRQKARLQDAVDRVDELAKKLEDARTEAEERSKELLRMQQEYTAALRSVESLKDEDTAALKERLSQIEDMNAEIRKNLDREKALAETEGFAEEYRALTGQIDGNDADKRGLLEKAILPLAGLSVDNGVLTYQGNAWDCMSGSDQLRVATAIVRKLNAKCGFVLLNGIEQMDLKTLQEFGDWLEAEGLQAITTRVSKGAECDLIISDGLVSESEDEPSFG